MSGLLVLGAGGHGKVIADAAFESGRWERIAFLDDQHPSIEIVNRWPVVGTFNQAPILIRDYTDIVVAVGNNVVRIQTLDKLKTCGFRLPKIVHPSAYVSKDAHLEEGCVVLAQSVINIGAKLGLGCIINTGATIDHDCNLSDGVHISPGAHLAGSVTVGEYSWIGIGASIIQGINIGDNVIVGAGGVVIEDLPANVVASGVPVKIIKHNA